MRIITQKGKWFIDCVLLYRSSSYFHFFGLTLVNLKGDKDGRIYDLTLSTPDFRIPMPNKPVKIKDNRKS